MNTPVVRPLYLLADSQPLFWKDVAGAAFLAAVVAANAPPKPDVAYIGSSNGDSPEAFSILKAALESLDIGSVRQISSTFTASDLGFLQSADVVVLAGGDVEAGWNVFTRTGMREVIESRYRDGALLIGVSAGAVQLGTHASVAGEDGASRLIDTFGLVRSIVDVHDEQQDWHTLAGTIHLLEGAAMGVGIRRGGGLIAHPDGTLEPVLHAVDEFTFSADQLHRAVLLPPCAGG